VEQLNFNDVQLEPTAAVALTGANTTTSAGTSGSSNLVAGPGTSGSRLPTLGPGSSIVPRVIREVVTVQPIIAANDDGSNQAEYFGNGEQQAEIFDQIDRIYAAAQVDIQFLPPRYVNNTFINIGDEPEGVTRGFDEEEIVVLGDELGVGNRDRLVLDVYFVQRVPGSEIGVLGIVAAIGGNGAVVESGEDLNTEQGRRNIATTTAHEIGHNLGLTHADGNDLTNNLMFPFAGAGTADELTNDFVQPPLMIPELNFFAPGGGQLDVIIASPFSVPVA
jgi:hypothetical protein